MSCSLGAVLTTDNTRAAFYELPPEIATRAGRDRFHRISVNKLHVEFEMASGRSTPTSADSVSEDGFAEPIPGVYYGGSKDKIDFQQFPLTPLGQLLTLCMTSGIASYPHPSVTLQYFETAVRYVEFWQSKPLAVQPMYDAMLDQRWALCLCGAEGQRDSPPQRRGKTKVLLPLHAFRQAMQA